MAKEPMKIAAALIVKGTDEEAELLDRCLSSLEDNVDGIFITRTQLPGETKNEAVAAVAKQRGAILSDFEWVKDFSAARNFNFSQVPPDYDYILWCDADDIWRGLEQLKDTLAANVHIEAFGVNYLYDWDEFKKPTVVHRKTMIVRNDGCVVWEGAIHEDLVGTRQIDVHFIKGIERLHLSNKERYEANAKRNIEIAQKQVELDPEDPRSYWNLGNSQFGVGDFAAARETFEHFLDTTESEDEKYLAYTRISDAYKAASDRSNAIKSLQLAIGLKPELPDAYFQLAYAHFEFGNYDKAEKYGLDGLLRRPQPDKMIVYNPRDYDYNPMMLMARVYFYKNRPDLMIPYLEGCLKIYPEDEHLKRLVDEGKAMKEELGAALEHVERLRGIEDKEELRKELDALPEDIRSHPSVCVLRNQNFVKNESSGKDLVIYCGMTNHEWNPELFKTKGFGGSEEAVIHLAREWARLGWNVTVYNNCGHKPVYEVVNDKTKTKPFGKVTYRPFWEWNYRDKQDVTILWRLVKPVDANINTGKLFIDLHDVVPAGEFTDQRLQRIDKVFVKTEFHRSLFPTIPNNKIAVIPNGFESYLDPSIKKDPYLVINTSSPDRSMDVLPALWKRVKERLPKEIRDKAKLKWAYGWDTYKPSYANDAKKMAWMEQIVAEMDDAGIEQLGKLPQAEVAKLYQEASFIAYPTEFAEIDCISVKKAQAAKCGVIATDYGALNESVKYGFLTHSTKDKDNWARPYQFHFGLEGEKEQEAWVDDMVRSLTGKLTLSWDGLDEWVDGYKWNKIALRWHEIFG